MNISSQDKKPSKTWNYDPHGRRRLDVVLSLEFSIEVNFMISNSFHFISRREAVAVFLFSSFILSGFLFPRIAKMSFRDESISTNRLTPADTPKLKFDPPSVQFDGKTPPKKIDISFIDDAAIDKAKLTIKPEAEYFEAAVETKDPKHLTLTITPKGKGGSVSMKMSYEAKDAGELPLIFGYKSVSLKDGLTALVFGEKKTMTIVTDPVDTTLKPENIDLKFDEKILKIDKTKAPAEVSIEAIGLGTSPLQATIKTFTFSLSDAVKVGPDEVSEVFLREKDKGDLTGTLKGKTITAEVFIPERTERTFDIMGRFKSSKDPKRISWLNNPKNPDSKEISKTAKEGSLQLSGKSLESGQKPTPVSFTYDLRDGIPTGVTVSSKFDSLAINAVVVATDFFLELSTPRTGDLLLPNGKVNILGQIRKKTGGVFGGQIRYGLEDEKKAKTWVKLVDEGSSVSLTWRNPTDAEIRTNYDITDPKAALPTRPDLVVVTATAIAENGEQIKGSISIRLAEIKKFAELRVKLNVMDEQTATDLYGSVTAKDYYVLMVRLFNDLKDQENGQPTGNSIIAYSGSMEIAVGLEKRYREKSDSSFPRTLSKKDVESIERKTGETQKGKAEAKPAAVPSQENDSDDKDKGGKTGSVAELLSPFETELATAQTDLETAVKTGAAALREYNQAAEKYENNLTEENYETAEAARIKASLAINTVEMEWERVYSLKENVSRWEYALRMKTRPEIGGPDTAINDGKWHTLSRSDFSRLVPAMDGIPRFQSFSWSKKIPPLPKPGDLKKAMDSAPGAPGNSDDDPPCVGTITYRPLTFEMVVNTVDRRDERSVRSKVFKMLDFLGTGTSFVTSFAVPGVGSDLPLGLEKYSNLLIPGLNKLFPSMKEQNRQNIVSQTMKPIEEIPYGSDITRVIFIPKRPFRGLIRGHEARISEICPFFFKIEVAVIQSATTVQQGVTTP